MRGIDMNKILFTLSLLVWALAINAQTNNRPYWISNLPSAPEKSMYYYRVTQGEEMDYDKAYAKAFARAIMESSWKLGLEVNTSDDLQTIENGVHNNIKIADSKMTLPLNKVCEYTERRTETRGVRVYILWQVAKYGNVLPNFDEFTKCE